MKSDEVASDARRPALFTPLVTLTACLPHLLRLPARLPSCAGRAAVAPGAGRDPEIRGHPRLGGAAWKVRSDELAAGLPALGHAHPGGFPAAGTGVRAHGCIASLCAGLSQPSRRGRGCCCLAQAGVRSGGAPGARLLLHLSLLLHFPLPTGCSCCCCCCCCCCPCPCPCAAPAGERVCRLGAGQWLRAQPHNHLCAPAGGAGRRHCCPERLPAGPGICAE